MKSCSMEVTFFCVHDVFQKSRPAYYCDGPGESARAVFPKAIAFTNGETSSLKSIRTRGP